MNVRDWNRVVQEVGLVDFMQRAFLLALISTRYGVSLEDLREEYEGILAQTIALEEGLA